MQPTESRPFTHMGLYNDSPIKGVDGQMAKCLGMLLDEEMLNWGEQDNEYIKSQPMQPMQPMQPEFINPQFISPQLIDPQFMEPRAMDPQLMDFQAAETQPMEPQTTETQVFDTQDMDTQDVVTQAQMPMSDVQEPATGMTVEPSGSFVPKLSSFALVKHEEEDDEVGMRVS